MGNMEGTAKKRAEKYILLLARLDSPHPDYLRGGKLVSISNLGPVDGSSLYLLVFDLHGGHDTVKCPGGRSIPYSELIENGGQLV